MRPKPIFFNFFRTFSVLASFVLLLVFTGCSSSSAPPANPTVTSVTMAPSTPTVTFGLTQQFTATVNGMNNPSQAVTERVNSVETFI